MLQVWGASPRLRWEQIGGLEEAKAALRQMVCLPLTRPDELRRMGLVPPAGVLLWGPLGAGLAMLPEACASEAGVSFVCVSGREVLGKPEALVETLRAALRLRQSEVAQLKVRAGMPGVLQILGDKIEEGAQVAPGANLARVANPNRLKAELKVPETQAKDVQIGQSVSVDTRNGLISGRVSRIDPAVVQGSVTVDVALDGELPKGARPDLSVDGTIELERLDDVLYVGRPVQGQPDSTVGLFKVVDNGKAAVRVPIKLGRSSVSTIEILSGLEVGDRVILSDMSQWDAHDRLRLE